MIRRSLPQRRHAETFDAAVCNQNFTVTVGFYADGTPAKSSSTAARPGRTSRARPATPPWC